jgi:hypothetical protein
MFSKNGVPLADVMTKVKQDEIAAKKTTVIKILL